MVLRAILRIAKYLTLVTGAVVLLLAAGMATGAISGGFLPIGQLQNQLEYDYLVVAPVAALGVFVALVLAYHGRVTKIQQVGTPNAEDVEDVPVPGDDFDALIEEAEGFAFRKSTRESRNEIKERLRGAAVAVMVKEGLSKPEARDRIESGSWTSSSYAASLLGGRGAPAPPLTSLVPFGSSTFEKSVNRTIEEIWGRSDVEEEVA